MLPTSRWPRTPAAPARQLHQDDACGALATLGKLPGAEQPRTSGDAPLPSPPSPSTPGAVAGRKCCTNRATIASGDGRSTRRRAGLSVSEANCETTARPHVHWCDNGCQRRRRTQKRSATFEGVDGDGLRRQSIGTMFTSLHACAREAVAAARPMRRRRDAAGVAARLIPSTTKVAARAATTRIAESVVWVATATQVRKWSIGPVRSASTVDGAASTVGLSTSRRLWSAPPPPPQCNGTDEKRVRPTRRLRGEADTAMIQGFIVRADDLDQCVLKAARAEGAGPCEGNWGCRPHWID